MLIGRKKWHSLSEEFLTDSPWIIEPLEIHCCNKRATGVSQGRSRTQQSCGPVDRGAWFTSVDPAARLFMQLASNSKKHLDTTLINLPNTRGAAMWVRLLSHRCMPEHELYRIGLHKSYLALLRKIIPANQLILCDTRIYFISAV